jgi:hypothetical protein
MSRTYLQRQNDFKNDLRKKKENKEKYKKKIEDIVPQNTKNRGTVLKILNNVALHCGRNGRRTSFA